MLRRFADGPIDFQVEDARGFSQSDVLGERRSAERSSAANGSKNESRRLCPSSCTVTLMRAPMAARFVFTPDKVQADPIVAVAGIFEQTKSVAIAGHRAADFREEIFVSVVVHVGEGDAVSFMEFARARGRGDVGKKLALLIVQQDVGQHGRVAGIAGAEINVEVSVVVDVAEVCAHGHEDAIETDFGGDIAKLAVAKILVELERLGIGRKAEIAADRFIDRNVVAGHKQIGPAVIVIVEKPCGETLPWLLHASLQGDVSKSSVVIVVIKKIVAVEIGNVKIDIAVVIVIGRNDALGESGAIDAGGMRDVFERAVAFVAEEMAGPVFVADEQIEIAVVINVGPDSGLRLHGQVEAAGCGYVGESAVAIVAQQRGALGKFPGATQDEDVETAVIVVIRLDEVQAAELVGKAGLCGAIGESSVAVVVEIMHRRALPVIGGDDVEQAVAFEIVDDEAAGHGVEVDAGGGSDVDEAADILGGVKTCGRSQVLAEERRPDIFLRSCRQD